VANLAEIMRPQNLDEVIGNEKIVSALKTQLESNSLSQTIMFVGGYGRGKTTLAKIIAKELSAETIELDAGSEGNIDNIREIVEASSYSSLFSTKKVFILDEVHQLGKPAQSALLKTLEDANDNVHFILLTTDPEKILKTIRSRCVSYELSAASNQDVGEAVSRVQKKFGVSFEDKKDFWSLIEQAEGSLRQVYSLLEKIISLRDENNFVSSENFKSIIGSSSKEEIPENLPKAFLNKNLGDALVAIKQTKEEGNRNAQSTMMGLYNYLKKVYVKKSGGNELMHDLAMLIGGYQVDWMHLEALAWKHLN